MTDPRDEFELTIMQYLDGALAPGEIVAFEARVQSDPEVAELLRQHRELDAALKLAPPLPDINWSALGRQISTHIDAEEEAPASLPMPWLSKHTRGLAIAASLALASALAFVLLPSSSTNTSGPQNPSLAVNVGGAAPTRTRSVRVNGPSPEYAVAPISAQITIGPSPAMAQTPNYYHTEALLDRPAKVVIEATALPADRPGNDLFH